MTSDKCYENLYNVKPHKESDAMGGEDPYSASKGAAELITSSFKILFLKKNPQFIKSPQLEQEM